VDPEYAGKVWVLTVVPSLSPSRFCPCCSFQVSVAACEVPGPSAFISYQF
jgi:hypothetical protein